MFADEGLVGYHDDATGQEANGTSPPSFAQVSSYLNIVNQDLSGYIQCIYCTCMYKLYCCLLDSLRLLFTWSG